MKDPKKLFPQPKPIKKFSVISTHISIDTSENKTHFQNFNPKLSTEKPKKNDIPGQIKHATDVIYHYTLESFHNMDKMKQISTENKEFTKDLEKERASQKKRYKQTEYAETLNELIDKYTKRGYKTPNLARHKNNLFNENPLLQKGKAINYYYRDIVEKKKLKGKNGEFDKHFKFMRNVNNIVLQIKNNREKYLTMVSKNNKSDYNDEVKGDSKLQREIKQRQKEIKKLQEQIKTIDENEEEREFDLYLKKKLPLIKKILNNSSYYNKSSSNNLSTLSTVKLSNNSHLHLNGERKKKNKKKFSKTIITQVNYKPNEVKKEQNNKSDIENLFDDRKETKYNDYVNMISNYFESKDIPIRLMTVENAPMECKRLIYKINKACDDYKAKDIWKANYTLIGRFNAFSHLLNKMERADNELAKLEHQYLRTYIKNS